MRTLVATVLQNAKGKDIYCTPKKINDHDLDLIRSTPRTLLEEAGFTFIKLISLEVEGVRGHAIFYEGHLDEMGKSLKQLSRGY